MKEIWRKYEQIWRSYSPIYGPWDLEMNNYEEIWRNYEGYMENMKENSELTYSNKIINFFLGLIFDNIFSNSE